MARRLFLAIAAVVWILVASGCNSANQGLTVWGLTEQNIGTERNALIARVGYQHDFIEGFVGSIWRPEYDVDTGEVKPPQVLSLGAICHFPDIIDPDAPVPWVPELLLTVIPPEFVATPYIGTQGSFNLVDKDAGYYGAIAGLLVKANPEAKSAFVAEAAFNRNFGDLGAVPDEWRLNLGFRFYFD